MGKKTTVIKFDTVNKKQIKGKVGHSRSGACTSKGKCYHGMMPRPKH